MQPIEILKEAQLGENGPQRPIHEHPAGNSRKVQQHLFWTFFSYLLRLQAVLKGSFSRQQHRGLSAHASSSEAAFERGLLAASSRADEAFQEMQTRAWASPLWCHSFAGAHALHQHAQRGSQKQLSWCALQSFCRRMLPACSLRLWREVAHQLRLRCSHHLETSQCFLLGLASATADFQCHFMSLSRFLAAQMQFEQPSHAQLTSMWMLFITGDTVTCDSTCSATESTPVSMTWTRFIDESACMVQQVKKAQRAFHFMASASPISSMKAHAWECR